MQGLFEILRMCRHVYTLTREDRIARGKLLQYEQVYGILHLGVREILHKVHPLLNPAPQLPFQLRMRDATGW